MNCLIKLGFAVLMIQTTVFSAPRRARLTLAEDFTPNYFVRNIDGKPDTYSFGYDIMDPSTGNTQFRNEERYPNGTVIGSYGYVDPTGTSQTYRYVADKKGYRVVQESSNKQYVNYATPSPVRYPQPDSAESEITWTRPKKPNKKKNEVNPLSNKEVIRRNDIHLENTLYYGSNNLLNFAN